MSRTAINPLDTGLDVIDLENDPSFAKRHLHARDVATQAECMERLARAFVENPDTILQELVNAAIDLCGAESAGISVEKDDRTDESFWHWVATAGEYTPFMNAELPRYPSACGLCLERGRPQLFRVNQKFFDIMGVVAPVVTDGLLLPWEVEGTRGTLWIMAHERTEAFDNDDVRMMQMLANFAAMGVRQLRLRKIVMEQEKTAAVAAMANDLAHKINNPLQALTNQLYIAAHGQSGDTRLMAHEMSEDFEKLSALVKKLLRLPIDATHPES